MAVAAEEATELEEDGESLPVVVVALTEDKKERTEEVAAVLLEVSEESGGGDPGGVVLKGISRICRVLLSARTELRDGFGRPVSSASLV